MTTLVFVCFTGSAMLGMSLLLLMIMIKVREY